MKGIWVAVIVVLLAGVGAGSYYVGKNKSLKPATTTTRTTPASTSSVSQSTGKTADYSSKGLTQFPKEVLNNRSISVLNLSHNNLTGAIPAEIHNLANLEELDLNDNQMTGIPAEVGQLKHLKVLNYANNKITGLPLELGNLTQLQLLDLSGNNVSQQDLSQIKVKLPNTQIKL